MALGVTRAESSTAFVPNPRLGMLLGIGAATGSALGLIPFKLATRESGVAPLLVILMFSAASLNTLASLPSMWRERGGDNGRGRASLPLTWMAGLAMGALGALANYGASEAVAHLDAAVAAVLIQLQVVFAALVGFAWLGERVSSRFIGGAALAAIGVAAMRVGEPAHSAAASGVLWGLVAAAAFGSMQVVVRRFIHRVSPSRLNALRLWIGLSLVAVLPGALAGALGCSPRAILLTALSAFCGPFLGRTMSMYAARHLPAALSTLFGLLTPVLALGADWAILHSAPGPREWVGGAIVIAGMLLALMPERLLRRATA